MLNRSTTSASGATPPPPAPAQAFAVAGTPGSEPPERPGPEADGWFLAALIVAQLGVSIAVFTPVVVSLSARVEQIAPNDKAGALSTVLTIGALLALIGNPLFGALSDRTRSRFGRRRPWLLGGMVAGLIGLCVLGLGDSVLTMSIGWAIAQLGINACLAVLSATIADRIPDRIRGRVSGAVGMMSYVAMVMGAFLAPPLLGHPLLLFAVPGVIGLVTVVWLLFALRGDVPAPADLPPMRIGRFLRDFWVSPRRHPDFAWNFLGRFLVFCGLASVTSYQMYYLMDHLHLSAAAAASAVAVSTLIMTVVSIVGGLFGGWASDRTGRRKPFVAASAIIAAAGLALIALAQNTGLFYLAMAVFGLGLGLYLAVDVALAVAVLPDTEHAAKDLGVLNIANALPQSLVPIIAPLFLGIANTTASNYAALFLFGTVCALLGALAIQFVRRVR